MHLISWKDLILPQRNGLATGLILISKVGGEANGELVGDYFQLDRANAFATGGRLVRVADYCARQEVRFIDFGSGSQFKILIQDPPGDDMPSFTYTVYDEAGKLMFQNGFSPRTI